MSASCRITKTGRLRRVRRRYGSVILFVVLSLGISLAVVAVVWRMSPNTPLIVAELTSEYVVQTVRRPVLARVPLRSADQIAGEGCSTAAGGKPPDASDGTLHPPEGAIVRYRIRGGRLSVEVEERAVSDGAASAGRALVRFRTAAGEEIDCELKDPRNVFVMPASSDMLLPIAGPAEIGIEFGAPIASGAQGQRVANLLLEGRLQIFAKSRWSRALYPVLSSELIVPAGSRLASSTDVTGPEPGDPWYGVAIPNDSAFRISATIETQELRFYRPGREGEHEYFSLTLFTRILTDPGIAALSFLVVTLFAVSQLVATIMGLRGRR